jgi:F0F1-type ATP synthase alpha subunit
MFLPYSDGIARVHGMTNVQAEELVEYVSAFDEALRTSEN